MRKILPVFVVFLFAGFASAEVCDWNVISEDFDDNSNNWTLSIDTHAGYNATVEGNCTTDCVPTFSEGILSLVCEGHDNFTCRYSTNGSNLLNQHANFALTKWYLVRARFKTAYVTTPTDDSGYVFYYNHGEPFYNGTIVTLYTSGEELEESSTSNNTWSDWHTWFFKVSGVGGGDDRLTVWRDGELIKDDEVYNDGFSNIDSVDILERFTVGSDSSITNTRSAEFDFIRVSNQSATCGMCDDDDGCDEYGEYCLNGVCVNTDECDTDADCFAEYGFGYYCNDNNHCSLEGFCEIDAECQDDEYCDVYTSSFYHTCRDKRNLTEACTHDNQCFQAECVNETPSVTICDSQQINECWPTGLCELDNTCWNYGMCYNVTADNYCDEDADCDADEFCNVWVDGEGNGICLDKLKLAEDDCYRDRWCDNETNNTYNEALTCVNDLCTPDSWECNWMGEGCGTGLACNWSWVTEVGDHLCVNGSAGLACDGDYNCSEGLYCLAGECVDNATECLYNNPDIFGDSNPNRPSDGYCDKVGSNESSEWCYTDGLNYTLTAGSGGGIPLSSDETCYPKFGLSVTCDYDYQCYSLNCDFSGNTSTKTCNPADGGTLQDSSVIVTMNNCEPSSNGLGWDCPVNDTAVVFARYRDEYNNTIANADSCQAHSTAFDNPDPFLTYGTTAYLTAVSFGVNTNINYTLIVECTKSGYGTTFSDTKYIYLQELNTTFVSWVEPYNNTEFKAGKAVDFKVKFRDITGAEINAGTCTFTLDGSDYTMENPYTGIYISRDINVPTTSGGYAYTATCTKSAYVSSTSPEYSLTVLQSHCFNGYKDGDETGEDCGGSCKPCGDPPDADDCFNNRLDACEWGVDCGGCCAKICVWSDCFNGVQDGMESGVDCGGFCYMDCDTGSCSNGIKDGDEKGIDCGGRCYQMDDVAGACFCDYTNDCDPSDGSWYCDYDRFDVTGICLESLCDDDDDCPDVQWDYGGLAANRTRVCDVNSGWCKWGAENYTNGTTADIVLDIQPLSGLPVYNKTFVGSCEDLTHGFIISTNRPTKKAYYFVAHPNSDSIPADSIVESYPFKDFDLGRVTNLSLSTIPKLCRSMTGESISARIVFKATEPSTGKFNADVVDIQVYAFMFDANVSLSKTESNVADFNISRNGSCFIRTNAFSNWTNISAAASTAQSYNFSDISSTLFFWMCNTTQGEFVDGSFRAGGINILFDLLGGIFMGLTGNSFKWFGWMIIPVFIILVIFVPLLYLSVRDRQSGRNGR